MFKVSENRQGDMFMNISNLLSSRKQKLFDSKDGWHNVFNREVLSRIDERPYSVLYDDKVGRPNAPIRILIGMMILKEGNGWSDLQLFEECRFNLKIMHALGLHNISDDVPVESTYYEFRRLLGAYNEKGEKDLLKETFLKITTQQVRAHGVNGDKIRLDSKLINSNIAKGHRLELVVEATRKYVKGKELDYLQDKLDAELYELMKSMQSKSTSNITYRLTGIEKKDMLIKIGSLMHILLGYSSGINYKLLERIYKEQYEEVKEGSDDKDNGSKEERVVTPKSPKDISSSSVQSIHDPEAAYRAKGHGKNKQIVSGFHSNITESCGSQDDVNLILDVDVVKANVSEDAFLIDSVDACQQVISEAHEGAKSIEEVITDGGYDNIANRKEMLKEKNPTWRVAKMKGGAHIYRMIYNEQGELEIYNRKTNEQYEVYYSKIAQKYVIKRENGSRRYLTKEQVDNYIKHQQIENQISKESHNLRASVESTIHQTFHRLKKNNKMVYRGLIKCQWYVLARAFWVNMIRIRDKNIKKALFFMFLLLGGFMEPHVQNRELIRKY